MYICVYINEKIKYWLELAEYDMETADSLLAAKKYIYVGFFLSMLIEKTLRHILAHF